LRLAALLISMGLLIAGCGKQGAAPGGKPAGAAPEVQWGEAVGGLQAGIAIKSPPAGPNSLTMLLLAVRNAGDKPVKVMKVAKLYGGSLGQVLEVRSGGQACRYLGPTIQPPPILVEDFRVLAPGESDSAEAVFSTESWGPEPKDRQPLKPPFKASITFRYSWQQAKVEAGPWKIDKTGTVVDGLWTGAAQSKPVEIEVAK
jgi:hypothetical protein